MPHFIGANHMLNQGFKHILSSGKKYDYIIATSSDTWFYDPKRLKEIIFTCQKKKFQLAASLWRGMTLGTEFFIITPNLAKKVFPLTLSRLINKFISKYRLLKWTHSKIALLGLLETIFTIHLIKVVKNPNKIYLIPGRRVVLLKNRFWSPNFYASHHDPHKRKKDILPQIQTVLGHKVEAMPTLSRFLS